MVVINAHLEATISLFDEEDQEGKGVILTGCDETFIQILRDVFLYYL